MNDFQDTSLHDSQHDSTRSCQAFAQDISLAAAGCLEAEETRALRLHLDRCADCRLRYEQCLGLVDGLRMAAPPVESSRFSSWAPPAEDLVEKTPATSAMVRRRGESVLKIAAVAASVALVIGGMSRVGRWHSNVDQASPVEVVRHFPGDEVDESAPLPTPTLLALRWAAVESEESFERLLARNTESMLADSLVTHPLSPERFP